MRINFCDVLVIESPIGKGWHQFIKPCTQKLAILLQNGNTYHEDMCHYWLVKIFLLKENHQGQRCERWCVCVQV